jgi:hypothetical protein
MRFYPPDAPVPETLQTDELLLRMLSAAHNPLDYDAVMASQTQLLARTDGRWPVEGFALADNLRDLQQHEADFLARTSFTYTVLTLDQTRCLGCVYIDPLEPMLTKLPAPAEVLARVPDDAAVVHFWVRSERLADELDRRLLTALLSWFREAWAFQLVTHLATDAEPRQLAILREAGLQVWQRYLRENNPGNGYLYIETN